jgi:hypothetical protein
MAPRMRVPVRMPKRRQVVRMRAEVSVPMVVSG